MQCSCGGDAKLDPKQSMHTCDGCGRVNHSERGEVTQDIFSMMEGKLVRPSGADHYKSLQPKIAEMRNVDGWRFAHEDAIIDHILRAS